MSMRNDHLRTDAMLDQLEAELKDEATDDLECWTSIDQKLRAFLCEDGKPPEFTIEEWIQILRLAYYGHTRITGLLIGRKL